MRKNRENWWGLHSSRERRRRTFKPSSTRKRRLLRRGEESRSKFGFGPIWSLHVSQTFQVYGKKNTPQTFGKICPNLIEFFPSIFESPKKLFLQDPASALVKTHGRMCAAFLSSIGPGRNYIRPPPPPPFLTTRHFSGEGGWGCIFWGPTRQEFYTPPPPPPFIPPPPLEGYFLRGGGGGVGVYKIWPRNWVAVWHPSHLGHTVLETFLAGALYREFREFVRILTPFLGKTHRNPP